ncbi:MAG: hypothetical protein KUG65_05670 [Sphingomonadaceae bacterium]|nr:hypothetical protein [Sphingomonadaceae bacterium]
MTSRDSGSFPCRIEQSQRAIDMIHIDHCLTRLVWQGVSQTRHFGVTGSKGG